MTSGIPVILQSDKLAIHAEGVFDGQGITVLKGSKVSSVVRSSLSPSIQQLRRKTLNVNSVLLEDQYFSSPSAASNFVYGWSTNGWVTWTTNDGTTLEQLRNGSPSMNTEVLAHNPAFQSASVPRKPTSWIIPCNPKYYDIFGSFVKNKTVDWRQTARNTRVGDIVYIYVGSPVQAIMFRTRVIAVNLFDDEVDHSDKEFNQTDDLVSDEKEDAYPSMRLELEKKYGRDDMTLFKMRENGFKGFMQGPRRVDAGIQQLIDSVESEEADPGLIQPAASGAGSPVALEDKQSGRSDIKQKTERLLSDLSSQSDSIKAESFSSQTTLKYRGFIIAKIYYRADAVRVEMHDIPAVHTLYEELNAESISYQRPSADPYSEPGKYSFFVDAENIEAALIAIIIAAQEGKFDAPVAQNRESKPKLSSELSDVSANQTSNLSPVKTVERPAPSVPSASDAVGRPPEQPRPVAPVKTPDLSNRLEKKLDSLLGAIATMHAQQAVQVVSEVPKEIADKRFRIEVTNGKGPFLVLMSKPVITGLIFTVSLLAVGQETCTEQYRLFFSDGNGEQKSDVLEINAVSGKEISCRFTLNSSASEEKTLILIVQGNNAAVDEVRQAIGFSVKIAFAADFGL